VGVALKCRVRRLRLILAPKPFEVECVFDAVADDVNDAVGGLAGSEIAVAFGAVFGHLVVLVLACENPAAAAVSYQPHHGPRFGFVERKCRKQAVALGF
jgi:hypothetical protein